MAGLGGNPLLAAPPPFAARLLPPADIPLGVSNQLKSKKCDMNENVEQSRSSIDVETLKEIDINNHVIKNKDDDFDIDSYYARLHAIPCPILACPNENTVLDPTEESTFSEIDLNSPPSNQLESSERKVETYGLTADFAQNLSQLPQVLPHVANTVINSFTSFLNLGLNAMKDDVNDNLNSESYNFTISCDTNVSNIPNVPFNNDINIQQKLPEIPLFNKEDFPTANQNNSMDVKHATTNVFRLNTNKKKTYAQIPGITLQFEPIHQQNNPIENLPVSSNLDFMSSSKPGSATYYSELTQNVMPPPLQDFKHKIDEKFHISKKDTFSYLYPNNDIPRSDLICTTDHTTTLLQKPNADDILSTDNLYQNSSFNAYDYSTNTSQFLVPCSDDVHVPNPEQLLKSFHQMSLNPHSSKITAEKSNFPKLENVCKISGNKFIENSNTVNLIEQKSELNTSQKSYTDNNLAQVLNYDTSSILKTSSEHVSLNPELPKIDNENSINITPNKSCSTAPPKSTINSNSTGNIYRIPSNKKHLRYYSGSIVTPLQSNNYITDKDCIIPQQQPNMVNILNINPNCDPCDNDINYNSEKPINIITESTVTNRENLNSATFSSNFNTQNFYNSEINQPPVNESNVINSYNFSMYNFEKPFSVYADGRDNNKDDVKNDIFSSEVLSQPEISQTTANESFVVNPHSLSTFHFEMLDSVFTDGAHANKDEKSNIFSSNMLPQPEISQAVVNESFVVNPHNFSTFHFEKLGSIFTDGTDANKDDEKNDIFSTDVLNPHDFSNYDFKEPHSVSTDDVNKDNENNDIPSTDLISQTSDNNKFGYLPLKESFLINSHGFSEKTSAENAASETDSYLKLTEVQSDSKSMIDKGEKHNPFQCISEVKQHHTFNENVYTLNQFVIEENDKKICENVNDEILEHNVSVINIFKSDEKNGPHEYYENISSDVTKVNNQDTFFNNLKLMEKNKNGKSEYVDDFFKNYTNPQHNDINTSYSDANTNYLESLQLQNIKDNSDEITTHLLIPESDNNIEKCAVISDFTNSSIDDDNLKADNEIQEIFSNKCDDIENENVDFLNKCPIKFPESSFIYSGNEIETNLNDLAVKSNVHHIKNSAPYIDMKTYGDVEYPIEDKDEFQELVQSNIFEKNKSEEFTESELLLSLETKNSFGESLLEINNIKTKENRTEVPQFDISTFLENKDLGQCSLNSTVLLNPENSMNTDKSNLVELKPEEIKNVVNNDNTNVPLFTYFSTLPSSNSDFVL